jgi:phosphohistidine phosphatase
MRRLGILRHAKSDWGDPGLDDHNRPLNERGWKAARRIGGELKQRRITFDLVLASTAARARETIDGVQETYDLKAPIEFEPRIYLASEDTLLELVLGLSDNVHSALFVGHNPGLQRLVLDLTRDDHRGLRQRIDGKYPTGAFAIVELPAQTWAEIQPRTGKIVELILPKDVD